MSLLEELARSMLGGGHIEIINLNELLRDKEPWEKSGDHLLLTTDNAKRTTSILRAIGRDDYADGFYEWFKAHTKPLKDLIDEKPQEDYRTDEERQKFIDDFTTRADALLPVADSVISAIRERHREAMRAVDCSDLFPIPEPAPNPEQEPEHVPGAD